MIGFGTVERDPLVAVVAFLAFDFAVFWGDGFASEALTLENELFWASDVSEHVEKDMLPLELCFRLSDFFVGEAPSWACRGDN